MSNFEGVSRRALIAGTGAVAAGGLLGKGQVAAVAGELGDRQAAAAAVEGVTGLGAARETGAGAVRIGPKDVRYENLLRGNNFRFVGRPDEICVAASAGQVVRAVDEAVRSGRRIAVRSGGHCFENLTATPDVRLLLDLSAMNEVGYDAGRRAFSVQPGATLGQVYRALCTGWGVTIPGGGCPEVGAGGHFAGGGYGPLSRRYGAVVDHLYGVEVVVVGKDGKARVVVATREPDDPNRELWWAHTGGGGGNFGVVTKYWLCSPGATGERWLRPVPRRMVQHAVIWDWGQVTESKLSGLLRNFGAWHERHSVPGVPQAGCTGFSMCSTGPGPAGAGGAAARRGWRDEPRGGGRALHHRGHGQVPPAEHLREAGGQRPGGRRHRGVPPGAARPGRTSLTGQPLRNAAVAFSALCDEPAFSTNTAKATAPW